MQLIPIVFRRCFMSICQLIPIHAHASMLPFYLPKINHHTQKQLVKDDTLNFDEQLKQINICALGPLRMNSALINAKALADGAKLVVITSQAGSVEWRSTQNKDVGGDYGHHMSRAACNMAAALLAQEVKGMGYSVLLLHPGFNRTEMTKKYEHIWDVEGAVDPKVGAKRVLYEVIKNGMDETGKFINCEDGLQIPW